MDITILPLRRIQPLLLLVLLACGAVDCHAEASSKLKSIGGAASPKLEPTYYWSNGRGSYKYAYDGGDGTAGAQSANEDNEVTGHYTYYEKDGTPVTVKYTAGVHGFQAEVLPGVTQAAHSPLPLPPPPVVHQPHSQTTVATAVLPYANVATAATAATAALMGVSGDAASTTTAVHVPLNFVNNVMKRFQAQPLQISFSTQQMHVQQHQQKHQQHYEQQQQQHQQHQHQHQYQYQQQHAKTLAVATKSSSSLSPVSKAEVQQINTLSTAEGATAQQHAHEPAEQQQWPKRPYAFAYESTQSAHSAAADAQGNVVGKYSYCDDAGYHDLAYKAGDNIGFQILGGNLAKTDAEGHKTSPVVHEASGGVEAASAAVGHHVPLLVVNVAQDPNVNYSYKLEQVPETNNINTARNGRSLRKFRRFANW